MPPMRLTALVLLLGLAGVARAKSACAPDAVPVGPVCVDRFEESTWRIPATNKALIAKVQKGKVTLAELVAGGAVRVGIIPLGTCTREEYGPAFPLTGNWTEPVYAVSLPGVLPSTCITWFQAEQACRLSGKRLLTNQDWQAAAAGTPDPGDADDLTNTCNTFSDFAALTGSRRDCVSRWGVHDMVGNAWEWTADWDELGAQCTEWSAAFGDDFSCIGSGSGTESPAPIGWRWPGTWFRRVEAPIDPQLPAAMIRGGNFGIAQHSGVFATYVTLVDSVSRSIGFRCAR